MHFRFLLILFFPVSLGSQTTFFSEMPETITGINFKNTLIETPQTNVITYEYFFNGGGVAAADFNNDGLIDLYFTGNLTSNKLYLNKGDFVFEDITNVSGTEGKLGWKTGVSVADVNGDGWVDIYICYSGDVEDEYRSNQLLINNGNLTFSDQTEAFGIGDLGYSTHAVFFDFDLDGDLDLYVLNHNVKEFRNFDVAYVKNMRDPFAGDKLYRQENGKFIDITATAGIKSNPLSYGLGVVVADFNNDLWPDIYVSNDYVEEDYLYLNNQNGTFREVLKNQINHISNFSMGVAAADVNNDGWTDIFTLDMLPEDNKRQKLLYTPDNYEIYNNMVKNGFHHQLMRNMLQLNNGNGTFSEIGQFANVFNTDWSWSALFGDLNLSGFQDLLVTNGYGRDMINRDFAKFYANSRLKHKRGQHDDEMFNMLQSIHSTPLKNYLFQNNGDLTFSDQSEEWGFTKSNFSHGAILADLDNDGDLDIVINKMNEFAGVYKNNNDQGHYLKVILKQDDPNQNAIGAKIIAYQKDSKYIRELFPVQGFQSSMLTPVHFGFKQNRIDSLIIFWPDGISETRLYDLKTDSTIRISKSNTIENTHFKDPFHPLFLISTNTQFNYVHHQPKLNDFKTQPLIPNIISYHGPKIAHSNNLIFAGDQLFEINDSGTVQKLPFDSIGQIANAVFFDANGDGLDDLYLVKGSYYSSDLQDVLFIQENDFEFKAQPSNLPDMNFSGSVALPLDFDQDGDLDLFVGGRILPGQYPLSPGSVLLVNDGSGNFTDETSTLGHVFKDLGMVTDAKWEDLNNDGVPELVICGEWMPLKVFSFINGNFKDVSSSFFNKDFQGWWNTIHISDLDQDGDLDIIGGNFGLNGPFKPSESQPIMLYFDDFDRNGFIDPIMTHFIQGESWPYATRDEITDQIVSLRQKFPNYESYSEASIYDIFPDSVWNNSPKLKTDFLETVWFENINGKFEPRKLPAQANFFPVFGILTDDFNGDGITDILLAGNIEQTRIRIGRMDAGFGCLLLGNGDGKFEYLSQSLSGLNINGAVRSIISHTTKNGKRLVIFGINGKPIIVVE
jgi:enediyne biosynthesis protein E4